MKKGLVYALLFWTPFVFNYVHAQQDQHSEPIVSAFDPKTLHDALQIFIADPSKIEFARLLADRVAVLDPISFNQIFMPLVATDYFEIMESRDAIERFIAILVPVSNSAQVISPQRKKLLDNFQEDALYGAATWTILDDAILSWGIYLSASGVTKLGEVGARAIWKRLSPGRIKSFVHVIETTSEAFPRSWKLGAASFGVGAAAGIGHFLYLTTHRKRDPRLTLETLRWQIVMDQKILLSTIKNLTLAEQILHLIDIKNNLTSLVDYDIKNLYEIKVGLNEVENHKLRIRTEIDSLLESSNPEDSDLGQRLLFGWKALEE